MKALITIFFMLTLAVANAQRICGSSDYKRSLLAKDPSLQLSFDKAEQQIERTLAKKYLARDTTANEIINIPIVVHVLYKNAAQNINDAQIISQIIALNKDYADLNDNRINTPQAFKGLATNTRIQFCLAQVDPNGRRTSGIVRRKTGIETFSADDAMKFTAGGGDDAWDSKRYLNIWVCGLGSRNLGYAALPGGPADKDGIVIAYDVFGTVGALRTPFDKGRTATHEVGHWLGLKHIWGDDLCGSDDVDDTPRQKSYNFGSPVFPHVTDCSLDANGDMFMNYMDFSDDAVMSMFTIGQKKRMRALFASGNLRNSFLTSFACDSTLAQGGALPEPETSPVADPVDAFKVYPNPVENTASIEYAPASEFETKEVCIYNILGVKVYALQINKAKTNIDLSKLSKGIYIVKIGEGKKAFMSKLIKL